MKRFMSILVACTMLLCFFGFASAADYTTSDAIKVSLVNQDPDPVEPGDYMDVRFKIENLANEPINDVQAELIPNYPFSLDPGTDAVTNVGVLASLQTDDRASVIKYKVRVSADAVEGTSKIRIRVRSATSSWSTYEFDIDIRTIDANLGIESVKTEPASIQPGKDATIQIKVKNLADSSLKDVSLRLDLLLSSYASSSATAAASVGSLIDVLPFAPMESGTEKRIALLAPGEEAVFTFKLHVYPTAESRVYKIPLQIGYYDSIGTEYTRNDIIGMVVNSEPDVAVVLEETTITSRGTKGEVTFKFVNKGLTDIKFMNVNMDQGEGFEIISGDEVYIGNIDSDDYETADFEIFADQGTGSIMLPVHYEYMDANNNKYSKDAELELKLYTEEEAKQLGVQESSSNLIIVLVIALAAIGLFIFLAVRKRRSK